MAREQYVAIADQAASSHGIPTSIFEAQIQTESNWNNLAIGSAGELGLAQIKPSTMLEVGVTNPFDPSQNLNGGALYLAKKFAEFGNWRDALRAYNAGSTGAKRNPSAGASYADKILSLAKTPASGNTNTSPTAQTDPTLNTPTDTSEAPNFFTSPIENIVYYLKSFAWVIGGVLIVGVLLFFGTKQVIGE